MSEALPMDKAPAAGLAAYGGAPVRTTPWPAWPPLDDETERIVLGALRSGRWAISEMHNGEELYERRFARAFAKYHGAEYCVPTTSGTSALTIAFEGLGLSRGAEVLVPGLTWVACASAVAGVGLVPVLVDVDPDTLCMSPEAAAAAVTPRTEAILLVHYACNTADMDAFVELARRHDLALIEDCAQAHGAEHRGRPVGTIGAVGTFSMQESKVLTCGEGGASITSDPVLAGLMEQYRADGRVYTDDPGLGEPNLRDLGDVQGRNLCLSEIHAAVLLGRLNHLEAENERRRETAALLDEFLTTIDAFSPVPLQEGCTKRTYYRYCIRVDDAVRPDEVETMRVELCRELGVTCEPLHDPLNDCALYNPMGSPQKYDPALLGRLDPRGFELPESLRARNQFLTLPHFLLLGDHDDFRDLRDALRKIADAHGL
ncbi:DegT/DnrJ/EryC1/StrS family aminotransferase [Actinomadura namibiensis]|uniref:L-glutamine:scyllo-inosose aminotransferase/L-glutamine:2-deoxy-scyllo-inosose/3-amino-2,3-dideoxy-scyllo-inosose aminotransferase n=1 Tax=Actinomadura namibiensis TaxID=182080 RepID=A0A7W3LYK9_ACTNM|nr:DegT/DnrJ/EryC1/StrS family aminotransferase [Actinomadura namibiensis]MBA8956750.1 L-glutamine:scyllo-inosose aminotransferase/L-glutamine:2-deoxy-scyllo-inosose/3-amino-2,3-dideoxy-scyllo-inosose aminotransferase [Actinomadura namibiensis]